jgi:protein-tyrosine phosphatase
MDHIYLVTGGKLSPIIDKLYLSCFIGAINENTIKHNKIDCIVKMYGNEDKNGPYKYHQNIEYLELNAFDVPEYKISKDFVKCFKFINDNIRKNKNVLVHCHAGISRSATIVIMYLMVKYKLTLTKAYEYVKSRRSIIRPNSGFYAELLRLDKFLNNITQPNVN